MAIKILSLIVLLWILATGFIPQDKINGLNGIWWLAGWILGIILCVTNLLQDFMPITRQQIFDKVAPALLKQNKQSRRTGRLVNGSCSYINDEGHRCAIGHLLPDNHPSLLSFGDIFDILEEYKDLYPVLGFNGTTCGLSSTDPYDQTHIKFLTDLQRLHDDNEPHTWPFVLSSFATLWNLNTDCLKV